MMMRTAHTPFWFSKRKKTRLTLKNSWKLKHRHCVRLDKPDTSRRKLKSLPDRLSGHKLRPKHEFSQRRMLKPKPRLRLKLQPKLKPPLMLSP